MLTTNQIIQGLSDERAPRVDFRRQASFLQARGQHGEWILAGLRQGPWAPSSWSSALFCTSRHPYIMKKAVRPHTCVPCMLSGKSDTSSPARFIQAQRPSQHFKAVSALESDHTGSVLIHQASGFHCEMAGLLVSRVLIGTRCHYCAYCADNILVEILMPLMVCLFSPE